MLHQVGAPLRHWAHNPSGQLTENNTGRASTAHHAQQHNTRTCARYKPKTQATSSHPLPKDAKFRQSPLRQWTSKYIQIRTSSSSSSPLTANTASGSVGFTLCPRLAAVALARRPGSPSTRSSSQRTSRTSSRRIRHHFGASALQRSLSTAKDNGIRIKRTDVQEEYKGPAFDMNVHTTELLHFSLAAFQPAVFDCTV